MRFLSGILRSVIFTLYVLVLLVMAIVTHYLLAAREFADWVPWVGALGVIVVLGAPYVLWPREKETDRPSDQR